MVTIAAYVAEDRQEAHRSLRRRQPELPREQRVPLPRHVPAPGGDPVLARARCPTRPTRRSTYLADAGTIIIGDPDDALAQCQRWADAGADQLVFGVGPAPLEETLEMIRLMGEHVIPKIDTDPVHSTTRYRDAAAAAMK